MTQDLIDWLNSTHKEAEQDKTGGISLLLVPALPAQPENPELPDQSETSQQITNNPKPTEALSNEEWAGKITALNDAWQTVSESDELPERDSIIPPEEAQPLHAEESHEEAQPLHAEESPEELQPTIHAEESSEEAQPELSAEQTPYYESEDFDPEEHSSLLNEAWHNAANLHINLDEPPQEMWTDIDSDDEPKDYEINPSLQGDAYIPVKHGANFTQRLHATLQSRKERAAQQREQDEQNANRHPYLQKALILCGLLVMTLGFAYFGLWFIQRETPDGLNERARTLYEQGEYDEAVMLYQRGYRRYPHVLTFLTGLARSAEKAGHIQTAVTAWNAYSAALPKDDEEHRRAAREELDRLIPGGETHAITAPAVQPKPQPQTQTRPRLPEVRAMTFDEALTEGNNAFNIGMYSRAITNFHKAHAIRENDIRPYIGLVASYRAKGMYVDAKRLLDEARRKFGRDPTLEVERYFLRRE